LIDVSHDLKEQNEIWLKDNGVVKNVMGYHYRLPKSFPQGGIDRRQSFASGPKIFVCSVSNAVKVLDGEFGRLSV
jgi:hypothetical protein